MSTQIQYGDIVGNTAWRRVATLGCWVRTMHYSAVVNSNTAGGYAVATFHLALVRQRVFSITPSVEFGNGPTDTGRIVLLNPAGNGAAIQTFSVQADTKEGIYVPAVNGEPWDLWASIVGAPAAATASLSWSFKIPCCEECGKSGTEEKAACACRS